MGGPPAQPGHVRIGETDRHVGSQTAVTDGDDRGTELERSGRRLVAGHRIKQDQHPVVQEPLRVGAMASGDALRFGGAEVAGGSKLP